MREGELGSMRSCRSNIPDTTLQLAVSKKPQPERDVYRGN
jgi:hypothetical protein